MVPPGVLRMVPAGTQGQQNYFITCPASEPSRSGSCVHGRLLTSLSKPWHPAKLSNWYNRILGTAEAGAPSLPRPNRTRGALTQRRPAASGGHRRPPWKTQPRRAGEAALPGLRGLRAGFRPAGTPGQHLPGTDERCEDKAAAEPCPPSHSRCHPLAYGRWVPVTFGTVPIGGTPAEPARPAALPLTLAMLLR